MKFIAEGFAKGIAKVFAEGFAHNGFAMTHNNHSKSFKHIRTNNMHK